MSSFHFIALPFYSAYPPLLAPTFPPPYFVSQKLWLFRFCLWWIFPTRPGAMGLFSMSRSQRPPTRQQSICTRSLTLKVWFFFGAEASEYGHEELDPPVHYSGTYPAGWCSAMRGRRQGWSWGQALAWQAPLHEKRWERVRLPSF